MRSTNETIAEPDDGLVGPVLPVAPAGPRRRWRTAGLWPNADFVHLWGAQTVSQLGTQVSMLALPLIAAIMLDASPLAVGLLAAAGWLPFLLFGLVAGVWVDRLRRRPVMIAADFGRALLLATIPIAAWTDRLGMGVLVAVALLGGTLTVFFDVAYLSYLPSLVRREDLIEGNSRLEASASAAQIVGPGLAGVMIRAAGAPVAVLLDALSFAFSALLLARIRRPEPPPVPAAERPDVWTEIGAGLRVVNGNPILRTLAAVSATVSVAGYAFLAIYVLFLTRDLGLGAEAVGLVLAAGGVGALLGTIVADPVRRRFGLGRTLVWSMFLFGATGMTVPLAVLVPSIALPMIVASEFLQWMTVIVHDVCAVSLRQAIAPDHLRGRVNGTLRFLGWGLRPIGSLLGGVLGGIVGLAGTLVLAEVGMFLAFGWYLRSPIPRLRDLPPPIAVPDEALATAKAAAGAGG